MGLIEAVNGGFSDNHYNKSLQGLETLEIQWFESCLLCNA